MSGVMGVRSRYTRSFTTARLARKRARRTGEKVHDLGVYERSLEEAVRNGYARRVNGSRVVYEVQTDGCLCHGCRGLSPGHRARA